MGGVSPGLRPGWVHGLQRGLPSRSRGAGGAALGAGGRQGLSPEPAVQCRSESRVGPCAGDKHRGPR